MNDRTFEWDENKNQTNIRKHGLSFQTATRIFNGYVLTFIDDRNYGELREISLGLLDHAVVIVVAHTDRNGNTRIISARPPPEPKGNGMTKRYNKELSPAELAALSDEEIDCTDIPELDDNFFRNARLVAPVRKKQITMRLDEDILDWFKASGKGYQTRMNAVLRAYVGAQRDS